MSKDNLELSNELRLTITTPNTELMPIEDVEEMSLADFQREKDKLAAMRQSIMLKLDGRKLTQAKRVMDSMDLILNRILDVPIDSNGNIQPVTPITARELKEYAEAYSKFSSTLSTLSRLDTIDGTGRAAEFCLVLKQE